MSSKESFLELLQRGLAVLAESEQQDILSEYAQHIDLKIAGGLTEEEAIDDFGDINQLTAEILEAYHVNPSYVTKDKKLPNLSDFQSFINIQVKQLSNLFCVGTHKLVNLAIWMFRAITAIPKQALEKIHNSERKKENQSCMQQEMKKSHLMHSDKSYSGNSKVEKITMSIQSQFSKIGYGIIRLLCLMAWAIWNGMLFLFAVPLIFLVLIILVMIGILGVWLFQGIPLTGSFICCIGILAFCVGILGIGSNLVWHRQMTAASKVEKEFVTQEITLTQKEAFDYAEK